MSPKEYPKEKPDSMRPCYVWAFPSELMILDYIPEEDIFQDFNSGEKMDLPEEFFWLPIPTKSEILEQ